MNFRITPILILLFCIQIPLLSANLKDIVHYTSESGLSNNSINCISQDKLKFIWIGTSDGLNRFDGSNFRKFRNIPNDSTSLQGNDITKIFIDSNDKMWVGTLRNGISKYDANNETFTRIKIIGRNPNDDRANAPDGQPPVSGGGATPEADLGIPGHRDGARAAVHGGREGGRASLRRLRWQPHGGLRALHSRLETRRRVVSPQPHAGRAPRVSRPGNRPPVEVEAA